MKDLHEPWVAIASEQQGRSLEAEVSREIGPHHMLAGKALRALARRGDCDDVLFEAPGLGLVVVHLAWSGRRKPSDNWPQTEVFSSLEDWKLRRMKEDHEDLQLEVKT